MRETMKEIMFKKLSDLKKRTKHLSISQHAEDKDCKTHVQKSFSYIVSQMDGAEPEIVPPQVYIKKTFNSKTKVETFSFEVKGSFYMSYNRCLMKVRFHHTLNIEILWKDKVFSPKKSAVLT